MTGRAERERVGAELRYALHSAPDLTAARVGAWWQLVRVRQQPRRRVALKAFAPLLAAIGLLLAPLAAPATAPPTATAATLAPVEAPPPAPGAGTVPTVPGPTPTPPQPEPALPPAVPVP